MRRILVLEFYVLLVAANSAGADPAKKVPLLPPPVELVTYSNEPIQTSEQAPHPHTASGAVDIELGSLGFQDNLNPDFAGADLLEGVRVGGYWPLFGNSIFVKPTVGYFARVVNNSFGGLAIRQHDIEGGLTIEYAHIPYRGLQLAAGVAQRLDGLITNTTSVTTYGVNNFGLRYRVGPTVSIGTMVSHDVSLLLNIEGGVVVNQPITTYGGATVGILYHLF